MKHTFLYLASCLASFVVTTTPASTQREGQLPPTEQSASTDPFSFDGILSAELGAAFQRVAHDLKLGIASPPKGSYDVETGLYTIDLGVIFGPLAEEPQLEDLRQIFDNAVQNHLGSHASFRGTIFRYGGYKASHWSPDVAENDALSEKATSTDMHQKSISNTVLVSAGHGYYRHLSDKKWRLQRDAVNSIQEDSYTQLFAGELESELKSRSALNVLRSRSKPTLMTHPPTTYNWDRIAARYWLEKTYPGESEIWNSKPEDTSDLREYKQDIRSRPLFANFIDAEAVFHLHTNADISPETRGIRVYYAEGRLLDAALGTSILCHMRQQIHNLDAYKDIPISLLASPGNHGENTYARVPSVIIETGFHTNVDDANAIKSGAFRRAAMKGVAKGYLGYRAGTLCEPFTLDEEFESVRVAEGVEYTFTFHGQPQFPVTLSAVHIGCPLGWMCFDKEVKLESAPLGQLKYTFICPKRGKLEPVFDVGFSAKDRDGLETNGIATKVRCDEVPGSRHK